MKDSALEQIVQVIFGFLVFFGLGLAALLILFLSSRYSRSKWVIIFWGAMATVLMIARYAFFKNLAGLASATNGSQHGYRILNAMVLVFVVALIVYFPLAMSRALRRNKLN